MRALGLAAIASLLLAGPALAIEMVELKDGRIIEAQKASIRGDNVWIELYLPEGKEYVEYGMPIDKVVPEFVFYIWLKGISDNQTASHIELAEWSRKQGLFRHARKAYGIAAKSSTKIRDEIPELEKTMHAEEAAWLFGEAERLFRDNDVKVARTRLERLLADFGDTAEVGRAKALISILAEREQFLSEQKKQEEIAARARKQRKHMGKQIDRVEKADGYVLKARISRPSDAKRRLRWAAYAYRGAILSFADLLPDVEVDDLRLSLQAMIADLEQRMIRTFLKLGDVEFITGDAAGALEAVHEVLSLDPKNKQAVGLRERILDGGAARGVEAVGVGYYPGTIYSTRLLGRRYGGFGLGYGHGLGSIGRTGFGVYPIHGGRPVSPGGRYSALKYKRSRLGGFHYYR